MAEKNKKPGSYSVNPTESVDQNPTPSTEEHRGGRRGHSDLPAEDLAPVEEEIVEEEIDVLPIHNSRQYLTEEEKSRKLEQMLDENPKSVQAEMEAKEKLLNKQIKIIEYFKKMQSLVLNDEPVHIEKYNLDSTELQALRDAVDSFRVAMEQEFDVRVYQHKVSEIAEKIRPLFKNVKNELSRIQLMRWIFGEFFQGLSWKQVNAIMLSFCLTKEFLYAKHEKHFIFKIKKFEDFLYEMFKTNCNSRDRVHFLIQTYYILYHPMNFYLITIKHLNKDSEAYLQEKEKLNVIDLIYYTYLNLVYHRHLRYLENIRREQSSSQSENN